MVAISSSLTPVPNVAAFAAAAPAQQSASYGNSTFLQVLDLPGDIEDDGEVPLLVDPSLKGDTAENTGMPADALADDKVEFEIEAGISIAPPFSQMIVNAPHLILNAFGTEASADTEKLVFGATATEIEWILPQLPSPGGAAISALVASGGEQADKNPAPPLVSTEEPQAVANGVFPKEQASARKQGHAGGKPQQAAVVEIPKGLTQDLQANQAATVSAAIGSVSGEATHIPTAGSLALSPALGRDQATQSWGVETTETPENGYSMGRTAIIAQVSTAENAWRQTWLGGISSLTGFDSRVEKEVVGEQFPTVPLLAPAPAVVAAQSVPMDTLPLKPLEGGDLIPAQPATDRGIATVLADKSLAFDFVPTDPISTPSRDKAISEIAKERTDFAIQGERQNLTAASAFTLPPVLSYPSVVMLGTGTTSLPQAILPMVISMSAISENGPLELALSPEELGRLSISIKQDGTAVHVTLVADRPETLDLLRRHGNDLIADLRQAGFSSASLSFGQGEQGQSKSFLPTEPAASDATPRPPSPTETKSSVTARPSIGSGVDLRF